MKVKINNLEEKKKFKPFDLVISIESEEEFKSAISLFNNSTDSMNGFCKRGGYINFCSLDSYGIWQVLNNEISKQGLQDTIECIPD